MDDASTDIYNFKFVHSSCVVDKFYDVRAVKYNIARGFVWVWNLVADIEGGTQAEGIWE
jgi:hypothetical protein